MKTLDWIEPARRFLTDRILRLRAALENLAYRLRDSIAATIGDAVAGILRALLDEADRAPVPRQYHGYDPRQDYEESHWQRDLDELDEDQGTWRPPPEPPSPSHRSRWAQALAAVVQASHWWLRRPPGGLPMACALGIATLAGVAAYVGAPAVSLLIALAGSTVSLVSVVDHAANEAAALADAVKP